MNSCDQKSTRSEIRYVILSLQSLKGACRTLLDPAGPQKSASEWIERVGTDDKLSGLKLNPRDQNLTKIDIGCDASSSEGPIGA